MLQKLVIVLGLIAVVFSFKLQQNKFIGASGN